MVRGTTSPLWIHFTHVVQRAHKTSKDKVTTTLRKTGAVQNNVHLFTGHV